MAKDDLRDSVNILKKQIKEKSIGKLYLFTGPERFLIRYYEKEIIGKILDEGTKTLNLAVYEGKVSAQVISDAISQYPAFSQRRVVVVKESTLLKTGGKDLDWGEFFKSLPDYICLIFIQEEVDKRVSFYKQLKNYGTIVAFNRQDEAMLTKWVMKGFASYKKQIDERNAAFLVSLLEPDMTFMALEIEKIARYIGESTLVTHEAINEIASKSLKSRIFDLTDAISQHHTTQAMQILNELIEQKEPIQYINAMVGRQIGILLKAKKLEEKRAPQAEMAKLLNVHPYFVGKIRKQAASFSMDRLKQCIRKCMEMDVASKTGRMDGRMALELFIIEMGK